MESIIIDNCVVSKLMDGSVRVCPIGLAKKLSPDLDIGSLPKRSYGSRFEDNRILSELTNGMKFEDVA